jgi:hypothetical protein
MNFMAPIIEKNSSSPVKETVMGAIDASGTAAGFIVFAWL